MVTSTTVSSSSCRSGVTTISFIDSGSIFSLYPPETSLNARLHLLGLLVNFIDRADHVERLLGDIVVLAFYDFLEAADGVRDLDVLSFEAGKLCCDVHRLREEFLDAARARHGPLVFVRKLFDTENGDNVLQILVALQNGFHGTRNGIVFLSNNAGIENARKTGQW